MPAGETIPDPPPNLGSPQLARQRTDLSVWALPSATREVRVVEVRVEGEGLTARLPPDFETCRSSVIRWEAPSPRSGLVTLARPASGGALRCGALTFNFPTATAPPQPFRFGTVEVLRVSDWNLEPEDGIVYMLRGDFSFAARVSPEPRFRLSAMQGGRFGARVGVGRANGTWIWSESVAL
eukprot:Hpha_TRINITY_DN16192_c0_g9::TRINITY_DN16192_c0_g9_i1::g.7740::m.7740